jgi:hypothetical protein
MNYGNNMNYEQAKELSFLVPWKATKCFSGSDCWCRIIVPVEPILYSHPESPDIEHEYDIVDAGALDQETAEYIVELHNEHCDRMKQSLLEISKGLTSDIIPFTQNKNTRIIHIKEID